MTQFVQLLSNLSEAKVDFILVGAMSAAIQGAQIATFDLDIVHLRTLENVERLVRVLQQMDAIYRGHPARLKPQTSAFTGPGHQLLLTSLGPLDCLGEIEDGQGYSELLPHTQEISLGTFGVHVLTLEYYLQIRRQHPRPRDLARFQAIEAAIVRQKGGGD